MTTVLIKKKDTAGAPIAGDLTNSAGGAELAVNTATGALYTKNSGAAVVVLVPPTAASGVWVTSAGSVPSISTTLPAHTSGAISGTSGIAVGGATVATSGIAFPATAVAVADANTLDDYEEGTWTPNQGAGLTVVGAFTSSGTYTKIGRFMLITGVVSGATSVAAVAAGVISSNLPVTAAINSTGAAINTANTATTVIRISSASAIAAGAIAATAAITFSATYSV